MSDPFAGRRRDQPRRHASASPPSTFDKQASELDQADVQRVIDTAKRGASNDGLQVNLGGQAIQFAQQPEQNATEGVGVVVAIVVLIVVLGSFAAMSMPLIVAFAGNRRRDGARVHASRRSSTSRASPRRSR